MTELILSMNNLDTMNQYKLYLVFFLVLFSAYTCFRSKNTNKNKIKLFAASLLIVGLSLKVFNMLNEFKVTSEQAKVSLNCFFVKRSIKRDGKLEEVKVPFVKFDESEELLTLDVIKDKFVIKRFNRDADLLYYFVSEQEQLNSVLIYNFIFSENDKWERPEFRYLSLSKENLFSYEQALNNILTSNTNQYMSESEFSQSVLTMKRSMNENSIFDKNFIELKKKNLYSDNGVCGKDHLRLIQEIDQDDNLKGFISFVKERNR